VRHRLRKNGSKVFVIICPINVYSHNTDRSLLVSRNLCIKEVTRMDDIARDIAERHAVVEQRESVVYWYSI
jgi:ferredoxin-like protein FixX